MLITVKSGSDTPATYPLGPSHMLIGRDPTCEIRVADLQASRRHACIHRLGKRYEIEDLRSGHGTLVNGSPISRHQLRDGDQIQVGDTELAFFTRNSQTDPTTAGTNRDLLHDLRNPLLVIQLAHQSVLDQLDSTAMPEVDRGAFNELLGNMQYGIDQLKEVANKVHAGS